MKKSVWGIISGMLVSGILLVLFSTFVIGAHVITPSSMNFDEDDSNVYNITINNSDSGLNANITEVNFTLPSSFTYNFDSNNTDVTSHTFTNTTIVLSWLNEAGLVLNETLNRFWFNASASTPGYYNISVSTRNATSVLYSNVSVEVNDTTIPATLDFASPTESDGANLSQDFVEMNVTATDNGDIDTISIFLFNSTNDQINTTTSSTSPVYLNISDLSDGVYSFNSTVNDTYNNVNNSATRLLRIDTTVPLVSYGALTQADYANVSTTFVYVNVSVTEVNEVNITFNLYNSTGDVVNSSTYTDGTRVVNVTGLADDTYTYNVTVVDYSLNSNTTQARTLTLDDTGPVATINTPGAGANLSLNFIEINVSVVDAGVGLDTVLVYLMNSTSDVINSSSYSTSPTYINVSGLSEGTYYVNATSNDTLGNTGYSSTNTVILDTTFVENITLVSPANATSSTTANYNFTFNVSATDVENCTLVLDGSFSNSISSINTTAPNGIYKSSIAVGTHEWGVNCTDYSNNMKASNDLYKFTVEADPSSSSSSSSGSSGGGSGYSIVKSTALKSSSGYSTPIFKGKKVEFETSTAGKHNLKVNSINEEGKSVTVTITSEPKDYSVIEGTGTLADLDGDGSNDLRLEVKDFRYRGATLTMFELERQSAQAVEEESIGERVLDENTIVQNNEPTQLSPQSNQGLRGSVVVVFVLILIIIVIAIVFTIKSSGGKVKRRNRKRR